jgi:hypothetical protein
MAEGIPDREREREREIFRRDPAENPSREGRPDGERERERFDGEIRQRFRRERDYPARRRERRGGFFVLARTLTPSNAGEGRTAGRRRERERERKRERETRWEGKCYLGRKRECRRERERESGEEGRPTGGDGIR